jgi:nitroreductase
MYNQSNALKEGTTHMNVTEAIRRKRAVRTFANKPLPPDVVEQILYAGRRAQSSKNSQPWHFIAIQDKQTLTELATMGDFARHLPHAGLAVAILTPDPVASYWVMFDAGQSAAYMQLEGVELGVASCMTTIHRPEGSRALLGYPDDLHLRMVVAFGYPADPETAFALPQKTGRKPISEVVHFERWEPDKA